MVGGIVEHIGVAAQIGVGKGEVSGADLQEQEGAVLLAIIVDSGPPGVAVGGMTAFEATDDGARQIGKGHCGGDDICRDTLLRSRILLVTVFGIDL